jgi:glutathione S-transferase
MILYTCGQGTHGPAFAHPCGLAGNALDDAGYEYELRKMPGYRLMPWTWGDRTKGRAEIKAMTGSHNVPVLVLDDGEAISGSRRIAKWAKEHPRAGEPAASVAPPDQPA